VDEGEQATGAMCAKPRRAAWRRRLLSRFSLEAAWIDGSWRRWERRLEDWLANHDANPEDEAALRNWFDDAEHYDRLWRRYRACHRLLRVTLIVSGVVTPRLVQARVMTLATVPAASSPRRPGSTDSSAWGERAQLQRRVAERLNDGGVPSLLAKRRMRPIARPPARCSRTSSRRSPKSIAGTTTPPEVSSAARKPPGLVAVRLRWTSKQLASPDETRSGRWLSHKGQAAALNRF
jgi:hypothetical protein